MRRLLLTAFLFFLMAGLCGAQTTDPCGPDVSSAKVASNVGVFADWGQPPADNIDAIVIYRNGTPTTLSTITVTNATPGSCGKVLYRVSLGSFAKGTYTLQFSTLNKSAIDGSVQEGPKSAPFALTVVDPNLPAVPAIKRIGS